IALVDPSTFNEPLLRHLADSGIVGVRFNLALGIGELTANSSARLLAWMKEAGWFLDIHSIADDLVPAMPLLEKSGVKLLFDHFGRPDVLGRPDQIGFAALLSVADKGNAYAKLSGAFRTSNQDEPFEDVAPWVQRVIQAFGVERCVWGSDWPFVNIGRRVDYGPQFEWLSHCVPNYHDRNKILWENPARLFGFG
ncbi:amidohydrolase family protein, partial [Necator americanus]